ncbi:CHL4-domain-containing protein [Pleurostoma richardsiae]|uniref:CHL4-domain-containing protein n=1 Tax=Pleurostoma richardsiae TaxID=41990 RepID=A0AA38RF32_9PEZI|nr:CHL4-domain-containing protein [Pleurostoma richardsiae]
MARISIPTTARLPSSLRLDPSNPTVLKVLNRLSRPALLTLALDWLDAKNQDLCAPYLQDDEDEDEDDLYPPAQSLEELQESYSDMQSRKGSKREVLDRILEGDWRDGLTLYQLAMADLQYLYEHPTSQKWTAYRIVPLKPPSKDADVDEPADVDKDSLIVPRFHPSSFLQKLQAQALPDVKAHYMLDVPKAWPLLLLRIFVLDTPYNTSLAVASDNAGRLPGNADSTRTIYVAFPNASPYIYISKSQAVGPSNAGETKSLRNLVVEGIPKALSRPRERYTLKSTSLSTRNLKELLHRRGPGRTNSAGGGWSIYSEGKETESPLDIQIPTPPLSEQGESRAGKRAASPGTEREERAAKKRRLAAQARFGNSAKINDGKGVERVDIVLEDLYPGVQPGEQDNPERSNVGEEEEESANNASTTTNRRRGGRRSTIDQEFERDAASREQDDGDNAAEEDSASETWRPGVRLTFHGPHVFAGIRQLVEGGVIDGKRMPGWLTGEDGVTIGAVRHGRIRGNKGSGL